MADNWRSRTITQGEARSPNRAMLRAVGFGDGDFDKAIVGVANGHSTMNPCNAGIQPLVDRAAAAVKAAGAMPQVFGFPTVTDGIGMGTEGMKSSLVSREVIADSIETAVNGQLMDGVLCVGGCDKNMPGAMMAMARINVPGIFVYAGTIKPGFWKGQKLTIVSPFEAVGALAAGKISQEDFDGIEKNACPSVGACGGQYTANTMSSSFEALGMSLLGSSQMASPDLEKAVSAAESAKVLVNAIRKKIRPRARRRARERARGAQSRPGRHPSLEQTRIRARAPHHPQGKPCHRRLRRQDRGAQADLDHGPGPRVRFGARGDDRDPREEDQGGRRDRDPLRRAQGRSRHAGDARTDV